MGTARLLMSDTVTFSQYKNVTLVSLKCWTVNIIAMVSMSICSTICLLRNWVPFVLLKRLYSLKQSILLSSLSLSLSLFCIENVFMYHSLYRNMFVLI